MTTLILLLIDLMVVIGLTVMLVGRQRTSTALRRVFKFSR